MKRLQIFKAGKQVASSGEAMSFTEDHLRKTVEAYDPKVHEAPIVVGHPRDNAPAYGWISGLEYSEDGTLNADTDQVMAEFAEMVQEGRFKKRSASFYKPDSPANPVPGVYYLRHVGFLGAQPPAVKGLQDPEFQDGHQIGEAVEFSDAPEDVVEFADTQVLAGLFRRMREFFIDRFGSEDADKVLPSFLIEDLEAEARSGSEPDPAFNEGKQPSTGDHPMKLTEEQIQELQAKANKADDLEKQVNDFKERESALDEREKKLARQEIERSVDALIDEGKIVPAERDNEIRYLESLDNDTQELEFTEGEGKDAKTEKLSQRAFYLKRLATRPAVVDFEERSKDKGTGEDPDSADYTEVAHEAQAYQDRQRERGINVTTSQAVAAVRSGKHKQDK